MEAKLDLVVSDDAEKLLDEITREHPSLTLVLDDTTCCTVSNILARDGPPWEASLVATYKTIPILMHPTLEKSLGKKKVTIDAVNFADDSLSRETNYGKRLLMLLSGNPS